LEKVFGNRPPRHSGRKQRLLEALWLQGVFVDLGYLDSQQNALLSVPGGEAAVADLGDG
jgi:hypothetical protein